MLCLRAAPGTQALKSQLCCRLVVQFTLIKQHYPHAVLGYSRKKDCIVTVRAERLLLWWGAPAGLHSDASGCVAQSS